MNTWTQRSEWSAALALLLLPAAAFAVQTTQAPGVAASDQVSATKAEAPVTLDSVVGVVNGDLILESDVDAERRFAAFQPFSEPEPITREDLINRLIDRTLILQQMALQPEPPIPDAEVEKQLDTLRKSIPQCVAYHCDTEAGWEKFVADQGFTMDELLDRWRQRMEVLRYIEERFRMGIRVDQSEIDGYYKNTLTPLYEKRAGAAPPPETTVADRIQEILLQQRVNKLLDDWLTALRAQGSVRILQPGQETP